MSRMIKRIALCLALLFGGVCIALVLLFRNELFTLGTLKKVDGHPLYVMAYRGDYGFSDF